MAKQPVAGKNIPEDVIQLVECEIATGPHQQTIVKRGWTRPVTYPEALLLEHIHQQPGKPDPVRRVKHVGYVQRDSRQEKARLAQRYGGRPVEEVFPGRRPDMERFYPMDAPKPGTKCRGGDFAPAAGAGAEMPSPKIEPDPLPETEAASETEAAPASEPTAATDP